MAIYVPRSIPIEAIRYVDSPQGTTALDAFCGYPERDYKADEYVMGVEYLIATDAGDVDAWPGDWIVKNAEGNLRVIKASDFERDYEAVS